MLIRRKNNEEIWILSLFNHTVGKKLTKRKPTVQPTRKDQAATQIKVILGSFIMDTGSSPRGIIQTPESVTAEMAVEKMSPKIPTDWT
jgi:hypothetical protein